MNPSTALARVLVDELVRGGVREAVLCPGSRSAPLAFALHDADTAGRLRLHVRIDERSGGFLALGLAKASGDPVPVLTTSGTATANLHPAVLEAAHSGVPLVVLTADRPPELLGVGANQSIEQTHLYGDSVRLFAQIGPGGGRAGDNAFWRSSVCRALGAARGCFTGGPGPVHLNIGLREPLVPDDDATWVEDLEGRPGQAPWTQLPPATAVTPPVDDLPPRTVVVLGDCDSAVAAVALDLAVQRGFPVLAEPSSGAGDTPCVVPGGDLVLAAPRFVEAHRPDRVLVVGRPTLSRAVGRLAAGSPCDVVARLGSWPDPSRTAARVLTAVPQPAGTAREPGWFEAWMDAGALARGVLRELTAQQQDGVAELAVVAALSELEPELLVVGSSKPVRDLLVTGAGRATRVLANRGVAGIDGMVSTAMGAALAHVRSGGGRTYALLGDLTFLHDANGLVLGPQEPRPELTVVVVNNDGGAIFGLLEQGAPAHAASFERVFGTPHGVDLGALCAASGTPYVLAGSAGELQAALQPVEGLLVVEVRTDRGAAVALERELRAVVAQVLDGAAADRSRG